MRARVGRLREKKGAIWDVMRGGKRDREGEFEDGFRTLNF
jgi:hypothetical protein